MGAFGVAELSPIWDIRKTELGFLDHKPWWLDSSSAKNRFYYCFGDEDEPREVLDVDKHSPHFMNFCGISYKSRVFSHPSLDKLMPLNEIMHFHSKQVKNKRRSRNKDGELVLKRHFVHESIDGPVMLKVFKNKILPWCKKDGLKLLIMDNDPKLHSKSLVTFMAENGVQIYHGAGKNAWVNFNFSFPARFKMTEDRAEDGYPARSHDCQPCETEFAEDFELSQQDVERREKNAKKKRTMVMWKNSVIKVWNNRPMSETHKLIDRMPKIMHAIIEAEGFKTPY